MNYARWARLVASMSLILFLAGCATAIGIQSRPAKDGYGPLTFNRSGGDFYFSQDGKYAATELAPDGVIEVHLKASPFQVGYNGGQMNMALAQVPAAEMSTDPTGYKASRLSGAMTGARAPDSDRLLVYGGTKWSDEGNTEFSDATSRKASPMPGYRHAYQVNNVDFVADSTLNVNDFHGTVYGFIVVYKQRERLDRDIMPLRLVFQ